MNIVVLDHDAMGHDISLSPLHELGRVAAYDGTDASNVFERVQEADILVVNKVRITRRVMESAPSLKLICEFATGYDNIDLDAASERGVAVCNVPCYSTESVALFTMVTALALVTHLREYSDFVTSGEYTASGRPNRLMPAYHELNGRTWGILGCGNIGSRVAGIAAALGMKVLVHQRHEHPIYRTVDIDTLCRESDILSIHCPLNASTRGIIDRAHLTLMKDSAIIVNEARGAVVNEADIAWAITTGKLAAFGADVYSTEPFGADHPYYSIMTRPNVLLTPHAAWGAIEARERCLDVIASNIRAFFDGGIQNRVDLHT